MSLQDITRSDLQYGEIGSMLHDDGKAGDLEVPFYDFFEQDAIGAFPAKWINQYPAASSWTVQAFPYWGAKSLNYLSVGAPNHGKIYRNLPTVINGWARCWIYDPGGVQMGFFYAHRVGGDNKLVGFANTLSAGFFVYRLNGGGAWVVTAVPRAVGWHELIFDYSNGADLRIYIDGILVVTDLTETVFNYIALGSDWGLSVKNIYYDQVKIIQVCKT